MDFSQAEYQKAQIDVARQKLTKSEASIAFATCSTIALSVATFATNGSPHEAFGCATFVSAAVVAGLGTVRSWRQKDVMDVENEFINHQLPQGVEKASVFNRIDAASQKMADYKTAIIFGGMSLGAGVLPTMFASVGSVTAATAALIVSLLSSTAFLGSMTQKGSMARQERSALIDNLLLRRQTAPSKPVNEKSMGERCVDVETTQPTPALIAYKTLKI